MSRVDDLLSELRTHLQAAVSYSAASEADDVYEGFLFSLVVATARKSGAAVHYEDVTGSKTHSLVFRTRPGRIWSRRRNYVHAVVELGTAPALEVHVGVYVQGSSGVEHECDVVVLDLTCDRISGLGRGWLVDVRECGLTEADLRTTEVERPGSMVAGGRG